MLFCTPASSVQYYLVVSARFRELSGGGLSGTVNLISECVSLAGPPQATVARHHDDKCVDAHESLRASHGFIRARKSPLWPRVCGQVNKAMSYHSGPAARPLASAAEAVL